MKLLAATALTATGLAGATAAMGAPVTIAQLHGKRPLRPTATSRCGVTTTRRAGRGAR
jgi:hypothetical protein